jgi:hypothetical protein
MVCVLGRINLKKKFERLYCDSDQKEKAISLNQEGGNTERSLSKRCLSTNINAMHAATVSSSWFLPLTGTHRLHALSAAQEIRANSCPVSLPDRDIPVVAWKVRSLRVAPRREALAEPDFNSREL